MNKRYLITKFCSLVLLVLLTACGGPKFTTGTYMNEKIGHSRIIFTSDGEYTAYMAGGVNRGKYIVEDNMLTWETDDYCEGISMHSRASYKLTLDDNVLSFDLVGEEKCLTREAWLTTNNWIKQEE